jgi:hypothetical protein
MYLCYAVVFASILFFLSCQKENQTSDIQTSIPKSILTASSREVNPFTDTRVRVENGMLVFDSYKAFNEIHEGLKKMNSNSDLNRATLVEMGYNPDTDEDEELSVIPQYPVLKAFAERHRLSTEEQKEDIAYKQYLRNLVGEDRYEGSCVYDPTLQAMLNNQRELGIGNFIVKFINLNKIALIYNKNLDVLARVRNTEASLLKDGFDLNMLDVEDAVLGANDIFSENGDDRELTGGDCSVKFDAKLIGSNQFEFNNLSQINIKGICIKRYEWDFGDGIKEQSNSTTLQHNFTGNAYPYTVTLTVLCGECAGETFSLVVKQPDPCDVLNFVDFTAIKQNGGNIVEFQTTGLVSGMTGVFAFGDPVNTATADVSAFGSSATHTFPAQNNQTSFVVTLTVTQANCPPITITKIIQISCGNNFAKQTKEKEGLHDGKVWKLKGVIWVQNNIFTHEMGSSSHVRRGSWAKNANFISTDVQGIVTRSFIPKTEEIICEDVIVFPDVKSELNSSYIDRRPAHPKGVGFRDDEFFSTHNATIGTGAGALPLNIDKLFLRN